MQARALAATAGFVLLLLAGGWLAASGSEQPDRVLAPPADGDRAHYETHASIRGPDGQLENRTSEHVTTWTTRSVQVPGADERPFPTVEHTFPPAGTHQEPPRLDPLAGAPLTASGTDHAEPNKQTLRRAFHYANVPSDPSLTTKEKLVQSDGSEDVHVFERLDRDPPPCTGPPAAWLAGKTPHEAEAALERCIHRFPGDVLTLETSSNWTHDPDIGQTWAITSTATVAADGAQETLTVRIKTSPALSLVLEKIIQHTETREGVTLTHEHRETLIGWENGTTPLPTDVPTLEPAPTVPLVDWTQQGPQADGIEAYPFPEALEEARDHPNAEDYFESNPDAALWKATYVKRSPENVSQAATLTSYRGCAPDASRENPLVAPDTESGTGQEIGWEFYWTSPREHMVATVEKPREENTGETLSSPALDRNYGIWEGTDTPGMDPPRRAPSLAALQTFLPEVPETSWDDASFVRVQAPWDLPWNESAPLLGEVGYLACKQDASIGGGTLMETGLRFEDGKLTSAFQMRFEREPLVPFTLEELTAPPGTDAPGSSWDPPTVLGMAGAILIAGTLATTLAPRVLGPLYSRLTGQALLEHPTRERLVDQIQATPGVRLTELTERLDLHPATARHHLKMLERDDWIQIISGPAGTIAFPPRVQVGDEGAILARAHAREILESLADEPGQNLSQLAEDVGVAKSQASRLVQDLEEDNLVDRWRSGRSIQLAVTEAGRHLLGNEDARSHV